MRVSSFTFLLLLLRLLPLQSLAMLARAFSAEDMVKAAAATTLGERCASEHIHCLVTARSIEVVSKEIQEYKRYKPYNFAIWLVNPRTGGTGVAYGCKDDTVQWGLEDRFSFFDGRNTPTTHNRHLRGFFDSNSYNKVLNEKIVTYGNGVNVWLYCDDQMIEDNEEQE